MAAVKRVDIQWLRAVAAIEVVICHSDLITKHFTDYELASAAWYVPLRGSGVELFFILSGYVICMRAPTYDSAASFLRSRILRLMPMYALFTSLVLIAYFINPAWRLNGFELTVSNIIASYLILPQWEVPIYGVGWTLEHEMMFYGVVALGIACWGVRGPGKVAIGWLLAALGLIGCLQGPPPGNLLAHHVFSPYMFAFAFGWLLRCTEEMDPAGRWINLGVFTAVAALAHFIGSGFGDGLLLRITFTALLFFGVVAIGQAFQTDNRINRLGTLLGDASFSIYLCHWFVLSAIGKVLADLQPPSLLAEPIRLIGLFASLAVGVLLYKLLEKPIDLWLRRRPTRPLFA